ncbi:MAG: TatD family hydrolase [Candidatus Berkelbacteria bacterium]|nr:TatD family hydrolase [Candidatus Berkelbacteria bacterium]
MERLVDSHCHLEDPAFKADRDEVIARAKRALDSIIISLVDPADFEVGFELVSKYRGFVFATAGLHPGLIEKLTDKKIEETLEKIEENKDLIVGIGETGLDYNWVKKESERERQKNLFIKSIQLAKNLDLPLVVHIRAGEDKKENDPYLEAIEILEKESAKRVLLHMFGAKRLLQRVLDNGWYISTNAIVLTGKEHNRIARAVPLERLMLETDSPYLVPEPEKQKGIKRNEPLFVKYVAERVAKIKEINLDKVVEQTSKNSKLFFKI